MFTLLLDYNTLNCFAEFIALYLGKSSETIKLKEYIELKSKEKGIVESYNDGLITQEEFCSFLMSHVYTQFVMNKNDIYNVDDDEIEEIRHKIILLLFGKLGSDSN